MTARGESADMAVRTGNDADGCASVAADIKRALVADLRECPLSRAEVAIALSEMAARAVSESQIDAWTAESKPHRIPVEIVGAWVRVLGSRRVLEVLCGGTGFHLAT